MAEEKVKPDPATGIAHFAAAARYSWGGLKRALHESAFRQELGGGAIALGLMLAFGDSLAEILGFVVLWLVLISVEALNTAVEALVDHVSPEWSTGARDAKDLGSFAVSCLIAANGIYVVWALFF
jgi:diacylglycerol kinase (ATP)